MSTAAPRILVTTSRGRAAEEYLDALLEAGAEPVLVAADDERSRSLDGVDGLLVTGGPDVDPTLYGAEPSPLVGRVDRERDDLEIALLREARDRRVPTLCICRGLQVANVAFGGTLIADIPAELGSVTEIRHAVRNADGRDERGLIQEHVVRIEPGSRLARSVGTLDLATGARHHQAVDRCADDLRVVGRTDDGVIEALEARFDSPFWLAVQWHPESTRGDDSGASRRIFSAFEMAARLRGFDVYGAAVASREAKWLAGLSAEQRRQADAMIARLERLGERDPIGYVRSEIEEDIPQTARWMAVRPLWQVIDGWREGDTLPQLIREARVDPTGAFADAWLAAARMLDAGVSMDTVKSFARGVAYMSIFQTLTHFSGASWPAEWLEADDLPEWTIIEVRDGELTGREVAALHEDLLGLDPSGREGRPPDPE